MLPATIVDTRSFQIYDRPGGRLGMRHTDSKVTVPVTKEPGVQTGSSSPHGLGGFPDEVLAIVGEYPVDTAQDNHASEHTMKKSRARPELRAAVSGFFAITLRRLMAYATHSEQGAGLAAPSSRVPRRTHSVLRR